MTPKQHECLGFIQSYLEDRGYSPSFDEIREALRLKSKSGVHRIVHDLIARGHLRSEKSTRARRSLVPAGACPVCGRTA